MTLLEFSKKLYGFHNNAELDSLQSLLEHSANFFIDNLSIVDENEFAQTKLKGLTAKDKKEYIIKKCRNVIDNANGIIKDSIINLNAEEKFYYIFFNSNHSPRDIANVQEVMTKDFYRMRSASKYVLYEPKELYTIPNNDNSKVGRYRFNPDGLPCLYLASNLYLSWEECRRPDFDMVNFARFHRERKIHVISIRISLNMRTVGDFIMGYFSLLCCAKCNDNSKYIYQYTVPNLFMKILLYNIRNNGIIDGIRYLSSRRFDCKDFMFDTYEIDDAYVFPQKDYNANYCPKLAKIFKMTKPRTHFLNKVQLLNDNGKFAYISDYQKSLFHKIEEDLKTEKLFDINF